MEGRSLHPCWTQPLTVESPQGEARTPQVAGLGERGAPKNTPGVLCQPCLSLWTLKASRAGQWLPQIRWHCPHAEQTRFQGWASSSTATVTPKMGGGKVPQSTAQTPPQAPSQEFSTVYGFWGGMLYPPWKASNPLTQPAFLEFSHHSPFSSCPGPWRFLPSATAGQPFSKGSLLMVQRWIWGKSVLSASTHTLLYEMTLSNSKPLVAEAHFSDIKYTERKRSFYHIGQNTIYPFATCDHHPFPSFLFLPVFCLSSLLH